jgi:uncharacterized protein YbjT (DUF2867 family)
VTQIVIVGGTGLIGRQVTLALCQNSEVDLHIVTRRQANDLPVNLHQHVAAPQDWPALIAQMQPDVAICCLGTTMKVAGSQAEFRAVDYDLVLAFAAAVRGAGARAMIAVSSVGASAQSSNFYLKTKGEAETALIRIGFERLDIIRPGLLTGGTRRAPRFGEILGTMISPLTDLLMIGSLSKYRSTPSAKVAKAICRLALASGGGTQCHENISIDTLTS